MFGKPINNIIMRAKDILLSSLLVVFLLNSVIANEEVTTAECGKSLTCYKQPNDATCTSSDTCNVLVMWKHNKNANTIDVILATKADNAYIGWAQNENLTLSNAMAGGKGVVCYFMGSKVKLESFHTTNNEPPSLKPLPTVYNLNNAYKTSKNSVICKFDRKVTVETTSQSLMYDLTDGLHQMYAFGSLNDAGIAIHYHGLKGGDAYITSEKVDLTPPEMVEEVGTDECGKSLTCYKQPNDATCTSSDTCNVLVTWKHNKNANTIDVTLATKADNAYISWAQTNPLNPTAKMAGAKGVVCYFDGSTVKLESFQTTKNTRPTLQATPTGYTLNGAHKTNKNSIICKFTRIVTVPSGSENLMYDVTNGLYQLYAHGGFKDDLIEYHGLNGAAFSTDEKVDLTSPEKTVQVRTFLLYLLNDKNIISKHFNFQFIFQILTG
ncbi:uncharacterized protein [Clytia hemisphaerica]|uniref:uncharacterized protein n=1 Tax=Clytia hemisphaerica TaxID=252671 RepID=UPI0034D6C2A8